MAEPTEFPTWDTNKTLATQPPESYQTDGWTAPGGEGEKPPLNYFNWWQANVSDWVVWLEERFDADNVYKLLTNVTSETPGNAHIGEGYQGSQFYGGYAIGSQYYGLRAEGDQFYGRFSEGAIEIGSTLGSTPDKKLISGAKEATFEEIIDAATINPWITATVATGWTQTAGNEIKYRVAGNNLEIRGSAQYNSGSITTLFTLPAGSRPLADFNVALSHLLYAGGSVIEDISISSSGAVISYNSYAANDYVNFNVSIPLD